MTQIMANVRAYKSMPRYLAVADGLAISGTSPNLTGTYNLSIVGFIRTASSIFPADTSAATAPGGAPGAPGAPGLQLAASGLPGQTPRNAWDAPQVSPDRRDDNDHAQTRCL